MHISLLQLTLKHHIQARIIRKLCHLFGMCCYVWICLDNLLSFVMFALNCYWICLKYNLININLIGFNNCCRNNFWVY
jgi:hypothetical protein